MYLFSRLRSLKISHRLIVSTATLALMLVTPGVQAQTFTWKGSVSNPDWSQAGNWVGNAAPFLNGNSTVIFGAGSFPQSNMNGSYWVDSLTFASNAIAYTIRSTDGSKLTVGAHGITQNSNNRASIDVSSIALGANQTWSVNGGGGLFVTAPITGGSSATLTKAGTGMLTLLGNNVYSGGTSVSGGIIQVGGDDGTGTMRSSNLGTGPVTIGFDTTVSFNASSTTGNIAITNNYGGSLNFNDRTSANEATITNQGSLFFKGVATGGDALTIANNGGSLNISGPSVLNVGSLSGAGAIRLGSAELVVGARRQTETISGAISGTGSLTKVGTGTLTLTGVNTQTGGLTVKSGILVLDGTAASGAGKVAVTGGNSDFFQGPGSDTTMTVSAVNALEQATELSISAGRVESYSKAGSAIVNINAPNVMAAGANVIIRGGDTSFAPAGSATLNLNVANALTNVGTVSVTGGAGFFGNGRGDAILNISAESILGNFGKVVLTGGGAYWQGAGAGLAILSLGVNDTAVSNRTQIVFVSQGSDSEAHLDLNGNSLTIGGIDSQGVVSSKHIVQNAGGTDSILTVGTDNARHDFGGTLQDGAGSGRLALVKVGNGTQALSGTSTYTGSTTLDGGTLLIGSSASLGIRGVDGLVINRGVLGFISGRNTLTRDFSLTGNESGFIAVDASDILTLTGYIYGTGVLNKTGAGTVALSQLNFSTGGTVIREGSLEVAMAGALGTGAVINNATLVFRNSNNDAFRNEISGAGNLIQAGSGTVILLGNNTYRGETTVQAGILAIGSNTALGSGKVTLNGGTLQANGEARTVHNAITFAARSGLSAGTVSTATQQTPGLTLAGKVTLASDGSLTVTGNTRVAITGVLGEDGIGRTLIKDGAGTLVLTNDNTYTGGTFVRAGTLVVNNAYNRVARGSGTGEGAVTVGRGATLTGTFAISGAVQVNSGGTLGIGNSIGTSSVSTLTLAGGSLLQFEIGDDGISSDRLDVTGLLTKSGSGPITFLLSGEQQADGSQKALSEGTFTLLTFSAVSGVSVNDFAAAGLTTDWASRFTFTGPTWDNGGMKPGTLVVTLSHTPAALAAPEPTSLLFLLATGGLGGIPIACRRRKGRAGAIA